ncbi:MAG TPA: peptidoglycan bridge formation glycyltransferase FemA/FemB family protein [Candidatus Portnoybacteria bacterium]|nr:peptidoglycan bridge formation glycyltransferase FemA/FemB family protein [Candidatus Portnoybacteria bacterium]
MLEEKTKETWNNFILANGGSFLQSFEWGEFQEKVGRKVKRLVGDNWSAQFIQYKLPCVNKFYWYCPRGPIMPGWLMEELIARFKTEIKEKNDIFFRLGPGWEIDNGFENKLKKEGFQQLPYDIEPAQTLILDIAKTEDELLAQMHEKWRYNIRLAERKGVQIKNFSSTDSDFEKYFDEFYQLVDKGTSERKEIKHHDKEYYKKQLEIKGEKIEFKLFVAEYENKVIAANIVVIFGSRSTYLHGATSSEHREVMAPHLLQWEQIKYAKAQSCSEYDFWGIYNEYTKDKRGKSWEGFTRFKRGFGGREVNYVGYFDYPLSEFWYFVYRLVQKFRR